jgi:beta-glucosidase/6-phospho-beta-glucosidase/beta-galactosidase
MTPIVFQQMRDHIDRAEKAGTDGARLQAYAALRDIVSWLLAGSEKYGRPEA